MCQSIAPLDSEEAPTTPRAPRPDLQPWAAVLDSPFLSHRVCSRLSTTALVVLATCHVLALSRRHSQLLLFARRPGSGPPPPRSGALPGPPACSSARSPKAALYPVLRFALFTHICPECPFVLSYIISHPPAMNLLKMAPCPSCSLLCPTGPGGRRPSSM